MFEPIDNAIESVNSKQTLLQASVDKNINPVLKLTEWIAN